MKTAVSSVLRRLASMIVVDDTPTDKEIEELRKTRVREIGDQGKPVSRSQTLCVTAPGKGTPVKVDADPPEYAAPPQQRRPRREPEHHKKWNDTDSTGLMKNYMQQYRADGKNMETNSPKSKYVKKPKV